MFIVDGVAGPLDPLLRLPLPQLDGQASALLEHDKTFWVTGHSTFTFHQPQFQTQGPHIEALIVSPYCLNVPLHDSLINCAVIYQWNKKTKHTTSSLSSDILNSRLADANNNLAALELKFSTRLGCSGSDTTNNLLVHICHFKWHWTIASVINVYTDRAGLVPSVWGVTLHHDHCRTNLRIPEDGRFTRLPTKFSQHLTGQLYFMWDVTLPHHILGRGLTEEMYFRLTPTCCWQLEETWGTRWNSVILETTTRWLQHKQTKQKLDALANLLGRRRRASLNRLRYRFTWSSGNLRHSWG